MTVYAFGDVQRNPLPPSSSQRPGLTATTVPSCGFSWRCPDDETRRGGRLGLVGLNEDLVLEGPDVHARHVVLHYSMVFWPRGFPRPGYQVIGIRPCPAPSSRVPAQGLSACHPALYTGEC